MASPFEGRLVRLRPIEDGDAEALNEKFDDPDVLRFLKITWPEPLVETRRWLDRARQDRASYTFAIDTKGGEVIGACSLEGINRAARSAALGIWIGKPHWDRGYGTDAVRTLCRFGFREANLQRIGLLVYEDNPRGKRVYDKVGFKDEGRLRRARFMGGRYIDAIVMGLLVEDLIWD